ncbi:UNKNOWN [Stylonychia lemnae]|uniref:Uncharacterized protein n=1 Tax=Stylonychia lemnae TaxID=5949 RepID=A0A078AV59_STYLE|nr:UNKNOWN [Stylonychia lemnae]|eukprot:CDW84748.1 UNKNOWN [Stylonychia lemnae]
MSYQQIIIQLGELILQNLLDQSQQDLTEYLLFDQQCNLFNEIVSEYSNDLFIQHKCIYVFLVNHKLASNSPNFDLWCVMPRNPFPQEIEYILTFNEQTNDNDIQSNRVSSHIQVTETQANLMRIQQNIPLQNQVTQQPSTTNQQQNNILLQQQMQKPNQFEQPQNSPENCSNAVNNQIQLQENYNSVHKENTISAQQSTSNVPTISDTLIQQALEKIQAQKQQNLGTNNVPIIAKNTQIVNDISPILQQLPQQQLESINIAKRRIKIKRNGQTIENSSEIQQKNLAQTDDTMISKLKSAVMSYDIPPHLIAVSLGLNVQLVRFIQHEGLLNQPKYERSLWPYSFINHKFNKITNQCFKRMPTAVVNYYTQNVLKHKHLTYEERALEQSNIYRLTYVNLRAIYKHHNIPKQTYKEKIKQDVPKKISTAKQIVQLLALELAEIKMNNRYLYYIDTVCISQSEFQMIISSEDETKSSMRNEKVESNLSNVWMTLVIDSQVGLIGYQIYKDKPDQQQYIEFINKMTAKLNQYEQDYINLLMQDASKDLASDQNTNAQVPIQQSVIIQQMKVTKNMNKEQERSIDKIAKKQRRWVVIKNSLLKDPKKLNECLIRGRYRILPIIDEEMNKRLNNVTGVWQYLANIWELKQAKKNEGFRLMQLQEKIVDCLGDMSNKVVKAIASTFNNEEIISYIDGEKKNKKSIESKVLIEQW